MAVIACFANLKKGAGGMGINNITGQIKTRLMNIQGLLKASLQNSLAGYLCDAQNPVDALVYIKYWGLTWAAILRFLLQALLKLGLPGFIRTLIKNPWILTLLRVNGLARRLVKGRTGIYHASICMTVHSVALGVMEQLRSMFFFPGAAGHQRRPRAL